MQPFDDGHRQTLGRGRRFASSTTAKLAAALRVCNSIMGGGVGFALEVNEPFRVAAAIDGFRYFGLTEVAGLLSDIADGYGSPGYDASRVSELERRVEEFLDVEDPLADAFRSLAAERPDAFGLS
jgi:hypothetical protein